MSRYARVTAAVFLIALAGCEPSKPAAVPAGGKVLFGKKKEPAAGALVVFHPTDPAFEKKIGGKPVGTVGEDGTFTLTTFEQGDGAPEGEYGVTVQWQKKAKEAKFSLGGEGGGGGQSMLNPKYGNPSQPFTKVTVKKGGDNQFTLDVD
ncbi:MAG: hypothetical protein MUF18_19520 [Fimbriiglobus sp.]|jgi:hypothetical protein|nr:hypothetical protein [Fimbriiglobus sp.]